MNIQADRLKAIPPYLFMELRRKIQAAAASGVDVISLAIGDPAEATPSFVVEELQTAASDPRNHSYPTDEEKGMKAFREAVSRWYERRYGVGLDAQDEVLGLIGSKEGVHHFTMSVVNPGDLVLMTDPGYPAYRANILMAGGEPYNVPLKASNGFLPDLDQIPTGVCRRAKAFFLNYPNNPTGACASRDFFTRLVAWSKRYQIMLLHDNPYSEIVFDGAERLSLLQAPGAKDMAVELNSLSKPYNMTGWRIGMAVGNVGILKAMSKVKENVDSGVFNAIQWAGIKALDHGDGEIERMLDIYTARRELVLQTFAAKGINVDVGHGSLYLWMPVPQNMSSSEFATLLFEKAHVVVAAGTSYGSHGEGFFRVSLTVPDQRLREAMGRIRQYF